MFWKLIKWVVIVVAVAYAALVIGRLVYSVRQDRALEEVEKIHATKLALSDVHGVNLPPPPGNPDATVAGVDANKNGIRDDVELAIFKEHPDSAKTRAVLLQYALALQMEVTQPIVNTETVIAVAQDRSRASKCIGSAVSRVDLQKFIEVTDGYIDFVTKKQVNTPERESAQKAFYENIGSYASLNETCDLDLETLPN